MAVFLSGHARTQTHTHTHNEAHPRTHGAHLNTPARARARTHARTHARMLAQVSGYTLHTWSDDRTALMTRFLDAQNRVIHAFNVSRGGDAPTPAPGPAPV